MKKIFALVVLFCLSVSRPAEAQIFYKITGNGLPAPSYIFGTHHMAPLSVVDSVGAGEYLEGVVQVVGEVDMTKGKMALAMSMQPHLMAPADSTLSKLLTQDKMDHYSTLLKQIVNMPGVELKMFDAMKPMIVSTLITLSLMQKEMPGFNAEKQLDTYFQEYALQHGKKVIPLETPEMQAAFLYDSMTIAEQLKSMCETLDNPEKAVGMAKALNKAYVAQDLDALFELTEKEKDNSDFLSVVLYKRNDAWMKIIPQLIRDNPTFIAVGALHLAGPRGLLQQLRNQGFTVTPVAE